MVNYFCVGGKHKASYEDVQGVDCIVSEKLERLLATIDEGRSLLGIGRSTMYTLIATGEIRVVRVGRAVRIPMTELHAFVERRTETAS